ncbi:MAG: dipeptidase [Marinicaulis sp.]|nr:dipeptidase [Marinicaulis sp.]
MGKILKFGGALLAIALIAGAVFVFKILPVRADAKMNKVIGADIVVTADAAALHETLRVADLHADTLLWKRNPAKRHSRGQTDLPRFRDGGFALQVFTAVTKSPKGQNYEENTGGSDNITLLAFAQLWPMKTWGSLLERALYQSERLEQLEEDAGGDFQFVRTRSDLENALATDKLAGIMGAEGAHPLEGEIGNVDVMFDAGYRVLGLQHFFDNELGGSLHGVSGDGLTEFGRAAVMRAIAMGMAIDVAHSSEAVVRDVLAMIDAPLIVSHTGLNGHCDSPRNISDETMKAIADAGGLIGVGFWDGAVCEPTPTSIAKAIAYAVELLGVEHVALGSDFDGSVHTPFDAAGISMLTQSLIDEGLDADTIRAVMGENAIAFFLENLPDE